MTPKLGFIVAFMVVVPIGDAAAAKKKRQRMDTPAPLPQVQADPELPLPNPVPAEGEAPTVAPREESDLTQTATVEPASSPVTLPKIELNLGMRAFARRLRFVDDLFDRFGSHSISGPAVSAEATVYRFRYVGFVGRGHYALGLSTKDAAGGSYDTRAFSLQGGLTTRLVLGPVTAGASLLLGVDHVGLTEAPPSGMITTTYKYVRPELYARLALGRGLEASLSVGTMLLHSTGELETVYFETLSKGGVGGTAGLRYELGAGLSARLDVDYRRFYFAMTPKPGDAFVVGGATDESIGLTLGVTYQL